MTQEEANRLKSLELAKIAKKYKSMGYDFQENFKIEIYNIDGFASKENPRERIFFIFDVIGDPNRDAEHLLGYKKLICETYYIYAIVNIIKLNDGLAGKPKIDLKPIKPNLIKYIKENYLKSLEERYEIKVREIKIHNDSIDNLVWNEVDKLYADGSAMLELYYGSTKFNNYIEIQINYKTKNFEILDIDFEF